MTQLMICKQIVTENSALPLMQYSTLLNAINGAGRTCYQSYNEKLSVTKRINFVKKIIKKGHHSVLEHVNLSFSMFTDRGVLAELTRHRLASYSVESTRYCNYANCIKFVLPVEFETYAEMLPLHSEVPVENMKNKILEVVGNTNDKTINSMGIWAVAMCDAAKSYVGMLDRGAAPQLARSVLPMSLAVELVMTANLREWIHIINLRTSIAAHPQIRQLAGYVKTILLDKYPVLSCCFNDDRTKRS